MNYIKKCFIHYADFKGRARRSEYWTFALVYMVVYYLLSINQDLNIISSIFAVALFLPFLSVSVRRMHDIGKSGFWVLIQILPIIGNIIFIALTLLDSKPGDNKYGPNPKEELVL